MKTVKELFDYDSLTFFGKVNASISHELKNVMAIISETAGLLNDLSRMASTGKRIDPALLQTSTDSIMEEIQRGFSTIRQMNRFAHSVDAPSGHVNLMEVLDLAVHLAGYLSTRKKTRLNPFEGNPPPMVLTCPFLLQAVVYRALVHVYETAGPDPEIGIFVQPLNGSTWRIVFSGLGSGESHRFPDAATRAMAASIGVAVERETTHHQLNLDIPETLDRTAVRGDSP